MRASIVVAAHQEGDRLWKTIAACVESTFGLDHEIVIADDGSTDGSVEEVKRRFPQVRVFRHDARRGAAPTKALGAKHARGDVLIFLDGHCKPEYGALARLVEDVEDFGARAIITPGIATLSCATWSNDLAQVGHGYFLNLADFSCGWLGLGRLKRADEGRRQFYESPALIGCALAVSRELYDRLRGFDAQMRFWGVEDLDFGLKCWLMGCRILHDPEAVVGHRFRGSFDNFSVPSEHIIVNQLRMARKHFTLAAWADWVSRCRQHHQGSLPDHPEGLWALAWELFEAERASAEHERSYLLGNRERDEFWYAERFELDWPRFSATAASAAPRAVFDAPSPSPSPSPSPPPCCFVTGVDPPTADTCLGTPVTFNAQGDCLDGVFWSAPGGNPDTGSGPTFTTEFDSAGGTYTVTASCNNTFATATVKVYQVRLIIFNGLEGYSGGQEIPKNDPNGAITVANQNDTNGDDTTDNAENEVSVSGPNPPGRNEIDLMRLILKKPVPDDGGNVTLKILSGTVKLWEKSTKVTQIAAPGGTVQFPTSALDKTIWVEATTPSTTLRNIVLQLEYKNCKDTVKATAVWVTKTARAPWFVRQAPDGFPNNPVPGPGNDLPDLVTQTVLDAIGLERSTDGSRYGQGTMAAVAGVDQRTGGRILHEFQIGPSGIEKMGVTFDVTRQAAYRTYRVFMGKHEIQLYKTADFPWQQNPVRDNELPNDDNFIVDEQNVPTNLLLYSFDSPGAIIDAGNVVAFRMMRYTFKEWVRVQLNNTPFSNDPAVEGSRASYKLDWHELSYQVRDASGKLVDDTADPSASAVKRSTTGNGPIVVTVDPNATTDGYFVSYDLPNFKWTLQIDSTGQSVSDQKGAAPPGTKWTLKVAGQVTVEITQGNTAFADFDDFNFSVFKSTANGGKRNEIGLGFIDVKT